MRDDGHRFAPGRACVGGGVLDESAPNSLAHEVGIDKQIVEFADAEACEYHYREPEQLSTCGGSNANPLLDDRLSSDAERIRVSFEHAAILGPYERRSAVQITKDVSLIRLCVPDRYLTHCTMVALRGAR
jgi:hypothetical protein